MAFCNNCGAQLEGGEKFCHACGTPVVSEPQAAAPSAQEPVSEQPVFEQPVYEQPVYEQPVYQQPVYQQPAAPAEPVPVRKRGGGVKIAVAAVAAVAVLAVIVILVSSLFSGGPVQTVFKAAAKTVEVTSEEGLPGLLNEVLEGGSMELTADLSKWEMMEDMEMKVGLKVYSNLPKQMAAATVNVDYEGAVMDAGLFAEEQSVALQCDALFGKKNVYGVDLSALEKNLPKSVLSPDADTDFSLDEDTYDQIMATMKNSGDQEKLVKETVSVLKEYASVINKSLEKNAEIEKTSETVSVGSEDIKTNQITITVDSEALAELVKAVGEKAQKDKDLQEVIAKWVETTKGPTLERMDMTAEEYVEEMWESLEDLDDLVDEIADSKVKITATFNIGKSSKTLVACSIKVKDGSETFTVKMTLGENPATSEEVKLVMSDGYDTVTVKYEVKEDTKKSYSAEMTASEGNYEALSASFNWDKSENTYKLTVSVPYEGEIVLKGSLTQKSGTTTITVDRLTVEDETMKVNATLVLKEKDSFSMPKFTDVLTLKEDDIEEIVETITDNASDLMGDFGNLPGIFYGAPSYDYGPSDYGY